MPYQHSLPYSVQCGCKIKIRDSVNSTSRVSPLGREVGIFQELRRSMLHSAVWECKWASPGGSVSTCQSRRCRRCGFSFWNGKILWRRKWQPTPVFLPAAAAAAESLQSCPTLCWQPTRLPCPWDAPGKSGLPFPPPFLPRKSNGQRSLMGYSPCCVTDTHRHTHTHTRACSVFVGAHVRRGIGNVCVCRYRCHSKM